jgi:hypothetical protein
MAEYPRRVSPTVKALCWCRCKMVDVTCDQVKRGVTESCGRRMCNALEFTALAASGASDPCDCKDR